MRKMLSYIESGCQGFSDSNVVQGELLGTFSYSLLCFLFDYHCIVSGVILHDGVTLLEVRLLELLHMLDFSKSEVKSQDRLLISLIPSLEEEIKGGVELGVFRETLLEQNLMLQAKFQLGVFCRLSQ